MKLVNGVRIVLTNPGFPHSVIVYLQKEGEPQNLTEAALVRFPIDIHIDEHGCTAILRIPVKELEINGIAIIEEPSE